MIPKNKLSEYVEENGAMNFGMLTMIPIAPSYFEEGKPESEWHPMQAQRGLTAAVHTSYIEVPNSLKQKLDDTFGRCTLVIETDSVVGSEEEPVEVPVYDEQGSYQWKYRTLEPGEVYEYKVLKDLVPTGYIPPEPPVVPTEAELLTERVNSLEETLTATQMAMCAMYEASL